MKFKGEANNDSLVIQGSSAIDTATFANGSTTVNGGTISHLDTLEAVGFDGMGGLDIVSITGGPIVALQQASPVFGTLSISGSSAFAALATDGDRVLVTNSLSITSGGTLDLYDNDMVVRSSDYATISGLIYSARTDGTWEGAGITSTAAREYPSALTTLGTLKESEYGPSSFDGITLVGGEVLVKYTYNGDADFSGDVDFDDYSHIDAGFNQSLSGWHNGDFNYDGGVPDFDDYSLIDRAFANQAAPLSPGDGDPRLIALGQMEHFTREYMFWFIDWNEQFDIYYTVEDFYPDGL